MFSHSKLRAYLTVNILYRLTVNFKRLLYIHSLQEVHIFTMFIYTF